MSTLFYSPKIVAEQYWIRYRQKMSEAFAICADEQLTSFFKVHTGLKLSKHISLAWEQEEKFFYYKNQVSKIASRIYINHNWNPITICWQSKSGRVYNMEDEDIDCQDIKFWFEGLDPWLYRKQLYPGDKLTFKLKDPTYELIITRLNMDLNLDLHLKPECLNNAASLVKKTDDFIQSYNEGVEKGKYKEGPVHNWKHRQEEAKIIYEIDSGFSGDYFLNKILIFFSKENCFSKVEIW